MIKLRPRNPTRYLYLRLETIQKESFKQIMNKNSVGINVSGDGYTLLEEVTI